MPITYDWDYLVQAYTSMYEQAKNADSENERSFAEHASGMLRLIPLIRDLPEFKNFVLDMSLGKLVCKSQSSGARVYLACKRDFTYVMQIYESHTGYSETKEFSLEQIVTSLQQVLKELSNK
jgi:hypothetical protein